MWLVNRQPLILQKIKTWMDMGAIALSFIMKIALHYTHLCLDLPSSAFTLDPCVDLLQLKRVQRWFGQPIWFTLYKTPLIRMRGKWEKAAV